MIKKDASQNHNNPLTAHDYTLTKILKRIIFSCLYGFLCLAAIVNIFSSNSIKPPAIVVCIELLLFIGFTVLFVWLICPKHWDSMQAVRGVFTYKQLKKELANQIFVPSGVENITESKLWLKVENTFVPKCFVLGMTGAVSNPYIVANHSVMFILINGTCPEYSTQTPDAVIKKIKKYLPDTINTPSLSMWIHTNHRKKTMKQQFHEQNFVFTTLENLPPEFLVYRTKQFNEFLQWNKTENS